MFVHNVFGLHFFFLNNTGLVSQLSLRLSSSIGRRAGHASRAVMSECNCAIRYSWWTLPSSLTRCFFTRLSQTLTRLDVITSEKVERIGQATCKYTLHPLFFLDFPIQFYLFKIGFLLFLSPIPDLLCQFIRHLTWRICRVTRNRWCVWLSDISFSFVFVLLTWHFTF